MRLKVLLRRKRWGSYGTFCREYDRAAALVDRSLMGSAPSRAQWNRWLSGELRSCRTRTTAKCWSGCSLTGLRTSSSSSQPMSSTKLGWSCWPTGAAARQPTLRRRW